MIPRPLAWEEAHARFPIGRSGRLVRGITRNAQPGARELSRGSCVLRQGLVRQHQTGKRGNGQSRGRRRAVVKCAIPVQLYEDWMQDNASRR